MKAAFFDIDGTLTSEKDGIVPAGVYESVRVAQANGNKMYLCSGRCRCHINQPFLDLHMDGMICGCGTQIILEDAGEIFHRIMKASEIRILHELARGLQIDVLYESAEKIGFDPRSEIRTVKSLKLADVLRKDFGRVRFDPESDEFSCDKACVFTDSFREAEQMLNAVSGFMTCIDRGNGLYELVPKGISKASGIKAILEHEHLSPRDAYGFGDSNNDAEMLRFVGHAVVMGNAEPETLKSLAEYVAPKASEDGIRVALDRYGFL